MSRRLDVLLAVKAMLVAALPGSDVKGLDGDDLGPDRITSSGRCIIEAGDPGRPEIDLSPPNYNYQHQIPVTLDALDEASVDAMTDQIAEAIVADRFLGGMVDYLDATAPPSNEDYVDAAPGTASAALTIVATYSSSQPL